MRRKLSIILVLLAWLIATGSQWDVVQVFAWGKMIVTYSRTMSVKNAVRLTFTPTNMCEICQLVKDAKAKQDAACGAAKAPERPVIIHIQPSLIVTAPIIGVSLLSGEDPVVSQIRLAPPLPPPREVTL